METKQNKILDSKAEKDNKKAYTKPTVAIQTFAKSAMVLKEHNLISEEEIEKIKKIHQDAVQKHIGINMFDK